MTPKCDRLLAMLAACCCLASGGFAPLWAGVPESARYSLRFQSTWSRASHPVDFPANPHFSPLIGGVHDASVRFWESAGLASDGIEQMAERGQTQPLALEVEQAIAAGNALSVVLGGNVGRSPGSATASFTVTREFPLVTLVTMLAPSPDWFAGVAGLTLFESGNWVEQKVITVHAYDAGTDSGSTYTSRNDDTRPPEPIHLLESGPFAGRGPVGTFTFTRVDSPPPTPLFLNGGRFKIEAEWLNFEGTRGRGNPVPLTEDTGYFWFFDPANVETVIKVLDGCDYNGHFWVFAGGLTNVEVELRVEDTDTGQMNVYSSPLAQPFQAIQDVEAFAACP